MPGSKESSFFICAPSGDFYAKVSVDLAILGLGVIMDRKWKFVVDIL